MIIVPKGKKLCEFVDGTYGKEIRNAVKHSRETGDEVGFWLCENGKIGATCVGTKDRIKCEEINKTKCPTGKPIGFFHTHPSPNIIESIPSAPDIQSAFESKLKFMCVASLGRMTCLPNPSMEMKNAFDMSYRLAEGAVRHSSAPYDDIVRANIFDQLENIKAFNGCQIKPKRSSK